MVLLFRDQNNNECIYLLMIRTVAVTYLVFICRSYNNVSCRQQDQKVHLEHLVLQSSQQ